MVAPELLKIGPYQGGHGCLVIPFSKGVCGAAARENRVQLVDDVHAFPGHIACSSSTLSEIVLPVRDGAGNVIAVFDIDSNQPAALRQMMRTVQKILDRAFAIKKDPDHKGRGMGRGDLDSLIWQDHHIHTTVLCASLWR